MPLPGRAPDSRLWLDKLLRGSRLSGEADRRRRRQRRKRLSRRAECNRRDHEDHSSRKCSQDASAAAALRPVRSAAPGTAITAAEVLQSFRWSHDKVSQAEKPRKTQKQIRGSRERDNSRSLFLRQNRGLVVTNRRTPSLRREVHCVGKPRGQLSENWPFDRCARTVNFAIKSAPSVGPIFHFLAGIATSRQEFLIHESPAIEHGSIGPRHLPHSCKSFQEKLSPQK